MKLARELGELIVDQLPPFIQPVKDLVEYVTDLMNSVKSDFMDFYNVSILQYKYCCLTLNLYSDISTTTWQIRKLKLAVIAIYLLLNASHFEICQTSGNVM